ncbi:MULTISPECIES: bifunctional GNAT family N-acetyltransferase/carbon-nitrogen hydrolase family protein [unclassified Flavobacterium]|jgi:predicted amidohydrolase/ribosomal protein S18 acetylase RimI-like enzyme|uniref:bifunctional GNAT family N-acetyltransferase/carbon-nitrogen hydrolase family protein n=1 Tax=unclassified Flavobacterium TaxID=196869 RepID=UPI00070DEA3B|nr:MULTISPECIES: bifunctional GNAT family N-acetyltransferase/carbon-nitrogen hydrolase family protein [unclassified Flavobacterium]KRD62759.1 carbon-nitrogen hydrolase [Flavobacterium sp. Root935]MDQ1167955.1 putative amidohydrolase/ribosomal protein S18 acetylase RimI-like enzyme [Flavobacterium sp. SORGH_AS_0622]TDX13367.1 putative amidohydrolase [Flavobacterium sp. S87F.05.LMB.W.Kidney.N]BDU24024.1 carbon-nitrogen hydrolase [Flavobacterium sp. GSB-24]
MQAKINKVELRNLEIEDYKQLKKSMIESYPEMADSYWGSDDIERLLSIFPEGQLVILVDGKVVGSALSLIVDEKLVDKKHNYQQISGDYKFSTHNKNAEILYGIDVFIHPNYRGLRLGRRLYDARKELCEQLNLKAIVFAGRIPSYREHAKKMSPKTYIEKVRTKELYDPVLSFQLSNDFHVIRIIKNYLEGDEESKEFAVLLEWNNIYYDESPRLINLKKNIIRLGLIQWQMRPLNNVEALFEQAEFFIDAVSGYGSDFALFPELFIAPLMADYNHLSEAEAIRELARHSDPIRKRFQEFAISYNINIITGSMPYLENGNLYNVGFLCKRDGTSEMYTKIHITPNEVIHWGMKGGSQFKTFDTDCGKIGILICYDVEFPEVSRLLADEGMNILFVPFLTDTQNGYTRVKHCSQARAIENECYVAIAGCVGNLPKVNNMDIQYAQSSVFTPSDFAFPSNGIKAEATPNTEMTLIVDVDLNLLKELHEHGSVKTLKDRRTDLYEIKKLNT